MPEPKSKYSAPQEAGRQRVFDEWDRRLGGRPPPTKRELLFHCKWLLDRPHLIEGAYAQSIFAILELWFANARPPKRSDTADQIGELVDWVSDTEKIDDTEARRKVAKAFHKTFHAVKQSHIRYRKGKRDKSQ
jgi:hypothetical protein